MCAKSNRGSVFASFDRFTLPEISSYFLGFRVVFSSNSDTLIQKQDSLHSFRTDLHFLGKNKFVR